MMASVWGMTPRESIEAECARVGAEVVVAQCVGILRGAEFDGALLLVLAGPAAEQVLRGQEGGLSGYWPRVWAMRGFLYAWNDTALRDVIDGANDGSWRVREMSAKVVARHRLDEALGAMVALRDDPIPRVRSAAERAIVRVVAAGS